MKKIIKDFFCFFIQKPFVDVDCPFFMFVNCGNSWKFFFNSIVNIYLNVFKKIWIRFTVISKIELKFLKINLMLELFTCFIFNIGIIQIYFKYLFIIYIYIYISNSMWFQNFGRFFVVTFSFEFAQCFTFFLNQNCQVRKIWKKKKIGWGWGFNPTI